jgi:hypothetical protein
MVEIDHVKAEQGSKRVTVRVPLNDGDAGNAPVGLWGKRFAGVCAAIARFVQPL